MVYGNVLDIGTPSDATVTNAKTNFVSTSSNAGLQIKGDNTTAGTLQLNCEQNSHGIKLRSPPHSASASYTLTFPNDDGSSGEALTTDGSGVLTWASAGGDNTPAFHVYTDGTQQVSNNTETTVVFDQEIVDTDNAFSSNQFTVPSGEGGKYYIYFMLTYSSGTDFTFQHTLKINNGYDADSGFRANGMNDYYDAGHYGRIINLSAGDVLKVVTYQSSGSNQPVSASENRATFGGYKLIGV